MVCGIWVGFDDKRVNFNCLGATGYGGRVAAPLWGAVMSEIYKIQQLPYKQKKFTSAIEETDSLDSNSFNSNYNYNQQQLPYRLTKEQLQQQDAQPLEKNNNRDENEGTFLKDEAMIIQIFNHRKNILFNILFNT